MVERKSKIAEVTNATTKQAAVFIVVYSWVIVRNIGKAINRAVYKLSWLFVVLSIVISTIVSIVFIGKARAERDCYNKKLVHATQLLDSYKNTYGGGREQVMENWNPNTSRRPVLSGIPIAVPDQKTVDRMTSLYYLMIGTLSTITQTAIKDLYDELYQRKDLFKFKLKLRIKEAFSRSNQLIMTFKKYTSEISQYDLWLDITDCMEDELKNDVRNLYYVTDNILLKNNIKEHRLQTLACIAYNMSIMLHDMSQRYDDVMKDAGVGTANIKPSEIFLGPMYGMYTSMKEVAAMIITDKDAEYFKDGDQIYTALQVIAMKVCDLERIEKAADEGLKLNGVDYNGELHRINSFTPWTGIQVNFLARNYEDMTDEQLAKALGRSVGSIKAKMKQLKLKRKE